MKQLRRTQYMTHALLAAFVLAPFALAHATNTLNITYFTIAETDQDANHLAGGLYTNEVMNTLGTNGFPILNTTTYGCTSGCYAIAGAPKDVLSDGEITYWSPTLNNGVVPGGTSDVTETGTGTVPIPYTNNSFYPPNGGGTSDYNGFQSAILYGTIDAPTTENIGFSIGSDDMAFLYMDATLQCSDGGVHGNSSVPCTTSTISAGDHSIELFFVDINNVDAALDFSINTTGITTSGATPEPGTFGLLGSGLLALAGLVRRKIGHRV